MNRTRTLVVQEGTPHERRHPLEGGGARITTFVPLRFKKRGGRKVVVPPAGVEQAVTIESPAPAIPASLDPTLIRAIARGFYWQHLLDTGVVEETSEIAEREGVHRVTVNESLRFALLAPDIVQAALDGDLPRTVSLEALQRRTIPDSWGLQREMIASMGGEV